MNIGNQMDDNSRGLGLVTFQINFINDIERLKI